MSLSKFYQVARNKWPVIVVAVECRLLTSSWAERT